MKKLAFVLFVIILITILLFGVNRFEYYFPNLYIKNFEIVEDDYDKVISILYAYYEKENFKGEISIYIDNSKYSMRYNDTLIEFGEEDKQSLKRVCENSYEGHYGYVEVSENDVVFRIDEANSYGIMYTKDFEKSKENVEEHHDDFKFRRINSNWYEIGQFRR